MSSNSDSIQSPNRSELGTEEALIIAAALIALLIFLAALRFGCNLLIDVCILDEMDRARRSIAEAFRRISPWWYVRTQPNQTNEVELAAEISPSPMVALRGKSLTKADIQRHKGVEHPPTATTTKLAISPHAAQHEVDSISSHTLMCSICLLELHEGDSVFEGNCDHIFHKECMMQVRLKTGLLGQSSDHPRTHSSYFFFVL
jgi:hypothetical protein